MFHRATKRWFSGLHFPLTAVTLGVLLLGARQLGGPGGLRTSAATMNELLFPVVVNGSAGEKTHYQTIFRVLNASAVPVQATLQIFTNAGVARGVFCSPLAPPPSTVTVTLDPNGQYLQFTSPDLPFLDGWAHLRWEGPASILAFAEVTLVSAPPAPCLLVCNRPSHEKLSSATIPALMPAREFRLPVTFNHFRQTAVALVNPSPVDSITVKLTLVGPSGENVDLGVSTRFEVRIRPQQRISRFLWELAREQSPPGTTAPVPDAFYGSVVLTSDAPFAVGALNIMFPEGKFVDIPAVSVP